MAYHVTSAPAAEPLLLEDIKNYLKVSASVTADDDLIEGLISEARQYVERVTSRALITQTITEYWDVFPTIKDRDARVIFPSVGPVSSVTSVAYVPEDGNPDSYTTLSDSIYRVDSISGQRGFGQARIVLNPGGTWPETEGYYNAVKVVYVAGYGASGAAVPGPLLVAMRRLIGMWYYGRKGSMKDDWDAVNDLLNAYKLTK